MFYLSVNSSKFNKYHVLQRDDAAAKPLNGDSFDIKAKLTAIDFVNETLIAFKGDNVIECDNSMKNSIKKIQYFLSKLYRFGYCCCTC